MKIAVAIDNWKLPIFERILRESGYEFEQTKALTRDSLLLMVHTDNLLALAKVVEQANAEAARTGAPTP
jgi:hypothetical protein